MRFCIQIVQFCLLPSLSRPRKLVRSPIHNEVKTMNKQLIAGAMSLLMMSVSATSVAAERISTAKHEVTKMTSTQLKAGVNAISFQSQGVNLSANLYLPANYTPQGSYPAVIFSPPFNQVKEQTGAVYAEKLAKLGYATLVFDHLRIWR